MSFLLAPFLTPPPPPPYTTEMKELVAMGVFGGALSVLGCVLWRRKQRPTVLSAEGKVSLPLVNVVRINHNSKVYVFAFPHQDDVLGLPVGQHVSLTTRVDGKVVSRAYTPVSGDDVRGEIRLAVKVYPEGKMTQHLDHMSIGDSLDFSGPKGSFEYLGRGAFTVNKRGYTKGVRNVSTMSMIAGGSGLTPVLQVIEAIYKDPNDKTKVNLMYANVTEADIWYKEELEKMQAERPEQFHFWYVVFSAC